MTEAQLEATRESLRDYKIKSEKEITSLGLVSSPNARI